MKLGLVEVTDKVLAEVGLFLVSKKDGTLRMIVDARQANAMFAWPPHTHTPLCNSELFSAFDSRNEGESNFSQMTADSLYPIYLGAADVDNCFHRIKIKEDLGQYFAQPGVFSSRELGVVGQVYVRVSSPDSLVRV